MYGEKKTSKRRWRNCKIVIPSKFLKLLIILCRVSDLLFFDILRWIFLEREINEFIFKLKEFFLRRWVFYLSTFFSLAWNAVVGLNSANSGHWFDIRKRGLFLKSNHLEISILFFWNDDDLTHSAIYIRDYNTINMTFTF